MKKKVNRKRSLAMKKSWALRRNSPGRELARERVAAKRVVKRGRIERIAPLDADQSRVDALKAEEKRLQAEVNELHAEKTRIRRMLASNKLDAMISAEAPGRDWHTVDVGKSAAIAVEFTDALLKELEK